MPFFWVCHYVTIFCLFEGGGLLFFGLWITGSRFSKLKLSEFTKLCYDKSHLPYRDITETTATYFLEKARASGSASVIPFFMLSESIAMCFSMECVGHVWTSWSSTSHSTFLISLFLLLSSRRRMGISLWWWVFCIIKRIVTTPEDAMTWKCSKVQMVCNNVYRL